MEKRKSSGIAIGEEKQKRITKDEVIAKLKDDGDFDNLRLKIIRKLKDNEELRNSVISIIRKSAALTRVGAENMKPRQLSDAIFDEVRTEVMGMISDGVWEIIRSGDGMKNEITETVQSLYDKLLEPERKDMSESSTHGVALPHSEAVGANASLPDCQTTDPPGFSLSVNHRNDNEAKEEALIVPTNCQGPIEEQKEGPEHLKDMLELDDVDPGVPPGFSEDVGHNQPYDSSDEDPEVPPGFG